MLCLLEKLLLSYYYLLYFVFLTFILQLTVFTNIIIYQELVYLFSYYFDKKWGNSFCNGVKDVSLICWDTAKIDYGPVNLSNTPHNL